MNGKISGLCILMFMSTGLLAQKNWHYGQNYWLQINYHASGQSGFSATVDTFALENRLYQISMNTTYKFKRGKNSYWNNQTTFDNNGRIVNRVYAYDTGYKRELTQCMNRVFNQRGQVASIHVNYYSKRHYSQFFEYNDSDKEVSASTFDRKDHFAGRILTSYDEKGKKTVVTYKSGKDKIKHEYRYYYTSDGQLKQMVHTGKKGKVLRVTDYTCDESGKVVKKMKDTAKVCVVKSYLPDGGIITTTHSFNYKGEPYKTVEMKNADNQILKYDMYYGTKEVLRYSYVYTYQGNKMIKYEFSNYRKENKPFHRVTEYDTSGRTIKDEYVETISRSKSKKYRYEYLYDSKGMILSERTYENNMLKNETMYSYNYYL